MATAVTYAPRTAHPIEHFARAHHRTLERWITKHFSRQLSAEDISDVLAETYTAALETDETANFDSERMSAWAYQVARFRAIGVIRARDGRAASAAANSSSGTDKPRRRVISFEQLQPNGVGENPSGETAPLAILASDSAYAEIAETLSEDARAEEVRRVTEAMLRLPKDQREALQYVHIDGLTVRAAADLLGTSKSSFDRLYRRALSRLQALCATEQNADCAQARALMQPKSALAAELVGWRDAHIEGCFSCQVAAGRRVKLLFPALPIIADRPSFLGKLTDRIAQLLSRSDSMPTEAVAAGLGTAGAGGTVAAGSTLISGVATKAAACAVAASCAAGAAVTVPAVVHHRTKTPVKSVAKAKPTATPRVTSTPQPAAATPVATVTSTLASDTSARRAADADAAAAAERERKRRAAARAKAKAKTKAKAAAKAKSDSDAEFSPESFTPATPAPPASSRASAASTQTTSPTTPSSPESSSGPGSSFSQEFRP
jgi:RNA polymerase sigma factor (sigma-70 family)